MGVFWYEGMTSSSQGTQRSFGFGAWLAGVIAYQGSPGDVGLAFGTDAAHL